MEVCWGNLTGPGNLEAAAVAIITISVQVRILKVCFLLQSKDLFSLETQLEVLQVTDKLQKPLKNLVFYILC